MESIAALIRSGLVKQTQAILLFASRYPDGLTVTTISVILGISLSATSMALDTLERRGLVRRQFPIRDTRSVTIYLTEAGYRTTDKMWAALQKVAVAAQMAETR